LENFIFQLRKLRFRVGDLTRAKSGHLGPQRIPFIQGRLRPAGRAAVPLASWILFFLGHVV
jgi:hypothetical protein